MRSFFSRLLVMNWGFLTILTLAVLTVFYFSTNLLPELQFLMFMIVWIFAFFGTFHISYKISENVTETLR
ncbi:MAG TPA: two-component sensor histidine kinase, partial [Leptospiraceae bacterium]|nr:two-component sensor histidine kinase [Leptospiraceae bacterium]